jgi:signal transduction histidine kinase
MEDKQRLNDPGKETENSVTPHFSQDKTIDKIHPAYRDMEKRLEDLRRELEQARLRLKEREEEMVRMKSLAALGEMAAVMVHELKNPLGGIRGFAELLERDLEKGDPKSKSARKIMEGVETLDGIVKSLLDYTKPIKLNPRKVEMAAFIDEVIGFFNMDDSPRKKDVQIVKCFPPDGVFCQLDTEQFRQILLNLLHNAVQAIEGGGKITVELSQQAQSPDVCQKAKAKEIVLKISDTGIGMSQSTLDKLFTPFFTTKEGGTGLGLSTVKRIVEAHRGDIRVESKLQKGTTVMVKLPVIL